MFNHWMNKHPSPSVPSISERPSGMELSLDQIHYSPYLAQVANHDLIFPPDSFSDSFHKGDFEIYAATSQLKQRAVVSL